MLTAVFTKFQEESESVLHLTLIPLLITLQTLLECVFLKVFASTLLSPGGPSPGSSHDPWLCSFRSRIKCHLLREGFFDHIICSRSCPPYTQTYKAIPLNRAAVV